MLFRFSASSFLLCGCVYCHRLVLQLQKRGALDQILSDQIRVHKDLSDQIRLRFLKLICLSKLPMNLGIPKKELETLRIFGEALY